MPTNEKEYNGFLFDQLKLAEQALKLAKEEKAEKTVMFLEEEIKYIERKLYQKPPLINEK